MVWIRRDKIREDEGKIKSDIKVVGRWTDKGGRKSRESVNIYWKKKRVNVKKDYRKNGKKLNNNVDADVTQLERSNNKYYVSTFRCI